MRAECCRYLMMMCVVGTGIVCSGGIALGDGSVALVGPLPPDAIVEPEAVEAEPPKTVVDTETNEPDETSALPGVLPAQERLSLGRDRTTRGAAGEPGIAAERRPSLLDHWAVRTVGALAIVIGLALILRLLARSVAGHAGGIRGQLGAGGRAPSGVMSVLARFPIARGQTLVLLRLDRRVLLLNQTPAGFATLTELVDAEEVASIVRKCEAGGRGGDDASNGFDTVLRAMERDPEVATGRLDGRAVARREAAAIDARTPQDPISRAQALLQATRRGNAAVGGGAA